MGPGQQIFFSFFLCVPDILDPRQTMPMKVISFGICIHIRIFLTLCGQRILQVGTKITFTEVKDDKKVVFRFTNEAGYDSGELSAGKISSSYPPEVVAGLCITEWQHGATVSISQLAGVPAPYIQWTPYRTA